MLGRLLRCLLRVLFLREAYNSTNSFADLSLEAIDQSPASLKDLLNAECTVKVLSYCNGDGDWVTAADADNFKWLQSQYDAELGELQKRLEDEQSKNKTFMFGLLPVKVNAEVNVSNAPPVILNKHILKCDLMTSAGLPWLSLLSSGVGHGVMFVPYVQVGGVVSVRKGKVIFLLASYSVIRKHDKATLIGLLKKSDSKTLQKLLKEKQLLISSALVEGSSLYIPQGFDVCGISCDKVSSAIVWTPLLDAGLMTSKPALEKARSDVKCAFGIKFFKNAQPFLSWQLETSSSVES